MKFFFLLLWHSLIKRKIDEGGAFLDMVQMKFYVIYKVIQFDKKLIKIPKES